MHLILINIVAESVMTRDSSTAAILSLGIILSATLVSGGRLNTDVLLLEVFGSKLIQEVLLSDTATFFISVLKKDLIEALDNRLHDLLKAETHGLLILVVGSDILLELLIDLLNDPIQPVAHVGVSQLDLL